MRDFNFTEKWMVRSSFNNFLMQLTENYFPTDEMPNANHTKRASMRDHEVILWFEIDDIG